MLVSFYIRRDNIYILCFIIIHLLEIIIGNIKNVNYILKYDKVLDTISPIFLIIFFFIELKLSKKKHEFKTKITPFKSLFKDKNKKIKKKNYIINNMFYLFLSNL